MPEKFGAVPCTAATANGAVASRAVSALMQGMAEELRQAVASVAAAASDRRVIESLHGERWLIQSPSWPFG